MIRWSPLNDTRSVLNDMRAAGPLVSNPIEHGSQMMLNHYLPSHTYTSVILQQGVVISLHKDSHNEEGSCNLLVSVIPAHGPILYGLRTSKVAPGACACHWRQLPLASMFDNPRRSSRRSMVAFDSSLLVILYQAAFLQDLLHLSR